MRIMRGCGYIGPDPQKCYFRALTAKLSARFARGQGSKGHSIFYHMDGIGVFPLFSTLMSYANSARFVGFIADDVSKGNNRSIVHNIADYKYAIIFITKAMTPGFTYSSLMAVLTPVKPELVSNFRMTGFHISDNSTTLQFPTDGALHDCQISINATSVNFKVTGDNIFIYAPWIFIY